MKSRESILKITKGFYGRAKNCYRIARQRGEKALRHAYVGRKQKKREHRSVWIQKINAGCREHHLQYNTFMHGLQLPACHIELNRKMLAELVEYEPLTFKAVVDTVKQEGQLKEKHYAHGNGYVGSNVVVNYVPTTAASIAAQLAKVKSRTAAQQHQ